MALPHVTSKLVPTTEASSIEPAVEEKAEERWSLVLLGMAVKISLSSEGCVADGTGVARGRSGGSLSGIWSRLVVTWDLVNCVGDNCVGEAFLGTIQVRGSSQMPIVLSPIVVVRLVVGIQS
jgi:hypothetical protein